MWDLVGNPEVQFSHNEAHINKMSLVRRKPVFGGSNQESRIRKLDVLHYQQTSNNNGAEDTARMRRLVLALVVRIYVHG